MIPFLISGLLTLPVSATTDDRAPFTITTKHNDDRVDVSIDRGTATFSIQSPCGISKAVIERKSKAWPDAIVLRLHFKGLEHFELSNGKVTLRASVSSHDHKVRVWKPGQEDVPLDATDPLWMNVRVVRKDGKLLVKPPLTDAYFEMHLPKLFFEENPRLITLTWIDFYRN
jgi:hypothetical protein